MVVVAQQGVEKDDQTGAHACKIFSNLVNRLVIMNYIYIIIDISYTGGNWFKMIALSIAK
jgi:hypothetical protein